MYLQLIFRPWEEYFTEKLSSLCGYVSSAAELDCLLQEYELATHSRFCVRKTRNRFGRKPGNYKLYM